MSSEQLGSGVNILKGDLAASFDILSGSAADYQDLGIARRFGGAAAAYSLRDIGAMNGPVVNVRREPHDKDGVGGVSNPNDETDFSASQVQSGALEDWVNGKLENTLPADVATASAAYSLRKVSSTQVAFNQTSFPNSSSLDFFRINVGSGATLVANTDGYQTKNDLAKFTVTGTDILVQFKITTEGYTSGRTGSTTFEYYIESDSPLVGKYWHIGNRNNQYSTQGVQIVGGAWTTATVSFSDKGVYESEPRFLNVRETESGGDAVTMSSTDTNPFIHFSSVSVNITDFSVLRIRRSSDQLEVNVGLDSDGKISNASPIGNISEEGGDIGSTTATTLGGFLTETTNMYTSNFATIDGFAAQQGAIASVDGIGGKDDVIRFTINSSTSQNHQFYKNIGMSDETVRVQGEVYIPSSNSHIDSFSIFTNPSGGSATKFGSSVVPTADQWVSFDITAQTTGAVINFKAKDGGTHTITDSGGDDVFYLANVTVDATQSSAFVHTWYDQAGSNNATQETDADQPKIAENGALITNNSKPAISFAGNDARLSTSRFLTSQGNTYFSVYDVDASLYPTQAGVVFRQGSNYRLAQSVLKDTDAGKIQTQLRDTGDDDARAITTASFDGSTILHTSVISATRGASGVKEFVNSANEASADSTDVQDVDFSTVSDQGANDFFIGSISSGAFDFLGNLHEIILFNTDESDNRFKIESNINNYYNLYNDANELAGDFEESGDTTNVVINGKDGFTGQSDDGNEGYFGAQLQQKVLDNDLIHISFNCNKGSSSPTVSLRKTSISGAVASDSPSANGLVSVVNGFNSVSFTSDDSDAEFISFQDNTEALFSVTDFKISRISRNGFVETWYDQSGNGNNATQGTAEKQPQIVVNGGQVTETQGKPAIGFQQTDTSFGNQEFLNTTSDVSVQAMYATLSIKDTNEDEQTVVGHGSDNNKFIAVLKQAANPSSAPRVRETSTDLKYSAPSDAELDTGIVFSYNRNASNNNVVRINNANSAITSGTDTDLNTDIVIQMVGARTNGLDSWRGKMQEVILFDRDTEDDRTDLQNDMANFYNITLS